MADSKGNDGILLFFFFVAVFWGLGWLIWKSFTPQLTEAAVSVRGAEMALADLWMDDDSVINVPMPRTIDDDRRLDPSLGDPEKVNWLPTKFGQWKAFADNAVPAQVTPEHIRVLSYVALEPLRYPIAGALFLMFLWTIYKGPTSSFHRVLGLEALMADQAKSFPVIRPFLKFNPNTLPLRAPGTAVPVELPSFAEALGPEEWLAVNEIKMTDNMPDRDAAHEVFARQLGPAWKGWQSLPDELQVLLAAFCLKASRKRNESDDLLGRLAVCWTHEGGLKLSRDGALRGEARKILKDKKLSEKTLDACGRHAYVTTAMMRALATARDEGGVLAPAQFLWLRAHNRGLWYPLNNLGRHAYHIEALGVAAHYRAEKQINRPISRPRVSDAVDGLEEFQKNTVLVRPIPAVDYGKKGKKKAA